MNTTPATAHSSAPAETKQEIKAAHLRYVTDAKPGIRREGAAAQGFYYTAADGSPVTDEATQARIQSLGIPPAYTDVWISPHANGYLQATGHDAKGRKQYRYHPHWRETRHENKYERMMAFGDALPKIRARVDHDLAKHGLPREKVLATVVRLLETTLIRVGNTQYARENAHYGLTTMQNEHVDVSRQAIHFHFVGKSGKEHQIDLKDKRLAAIVSRLRDLPGHEIFQYVGDDGARHPLDSADVNAYLHEIAGEEFTVKDFRTWAGTVLASLALLEMEAFGTETQAKHNITAAVKTVASRLGNTPAICRKCYVHPAVLDSYLDGSLRQALSRSAAKRTAADTLHDLQPEEAAVLALLTRRLG